ncbi:MAG: translesion error-prone DNA polymerase V autoproteolytic subunit [Bacteroidales bacterium]|nr:translesion error-prone DNA polymerase V autoproteolytic subunit [Bacteroidales bacterium]
MHDVRFITSDLSSSMPLPYADGGVRAGFPSPAQDYMEGTIDLNKELIQHPAATFYCRVVGDSMIEAGIHPNDILVVDKSREPSDGCFAICFLNGEFTVKELDLSQRSQNIIRLLPHNAKYEPIIVHTEDAFEIWGVVSYVIHKT